MIGCGIEKRAVSAAILCLAALTGGLLGGCRGPSSDGSPAAAAQWLRANAYLFETSEPGSEFDDLRAFQDLIGDARIVALGEATHGTREFFQMKHRLIELLVEEMGFSLIAIEANGPEVSLLNEYVQTGRGEERALLSRLRYWTWNTQEFLDLIHWMRSQNQDPEGGHRVSLAGFDMQSPELAMDNVLAYFQEVDPDYASIARARYTCLRLERLYDYAERPPADQVICRECLEGVLERLVARQDIYQARSSAEEFAWIEQNARFVLQAEDCLSQLDRCDRDRYMAENIIWLLEQLEPEAKVVLWAHNVHVANGVVLGRSTMGAYLKELYGPEMVSVGLTFYRGSFNAIGYNRDTGRLEELSAYDAPSAPRGSHEWYLSRARMPRMIVDLRAIPDPNGSAETEWLAEPRAFRSIGAVYDPDVSASEYFREVRLAREFDVIVYFERTTPSLPLSLAQRRRLWRL